MIIGYSVLYVNEDIILKDILWNRRVVYNSWEKVIDIARQKSNEEIERCEDSFMISLIKATSQKECEKYGSTLAYTIKWKKQGDIGDIYIVPVYDE